MSRRLEYFTKHRIIFRRDPITDVPTEQYEWGDYYADGTHECYSLFQSKAKINSNKSFAWHALVLKYLNPMLELNELKNLFNYIADKRNGFVTFDIRQGFIDALAEDLYNKDLDYPPSNRIRKVIFKDTCGLTTNEKLSIVGSLIGRGKRVTPELIYDAMLHVNDNGEKITFNKLAKLLNCSTRTIHRNINDELKKEKDILNQGHEEVQRDQLHPI